MMSGPRRRFSFAVVLALAAASPALVNEARAQAMELDANQLSNLGVTLGQPEPAMRIPVLAATARVVIPASAEFVVAAPQPGRVTGLTAAAGEEVTEGQVLAEVYSPEFLSLQRDYLAALSERRLAAAQAQRDRELLAEGIIANRRFDESRAQARAAEARYSELRQVLQMGGFTEAQLQSLAAGGELLATQALRAPRAGTLLERLATTGEQIGAMEPVYRAADLSTLWLELEVPEEHVGKLATGMTVALGETEAGPSATIILIGRAVDPETQMVMVRAAFMDGRPPVRPGQVLSVTVFASTADVQSPVYAVPSAAIARSQTVSGLFVRTRQGFDFREVRILATGDGRSYVTGSLEPGDNVAVTGLAALKALRAGLEEPAD
jgi:cobalt-zinc-cadmium efflux system membrane fusion protein